MQDVIQELAAKATDEWAKLDPESKAKGDVYSEAVVVLEHWRRKTEKRRAKNKAAKKSRKKNRAKKSGGRK